MALEDISNEDWELCKLMELVCIGKATKEESIEEEAKQRVLKEFHKFLDVFGDGFLKKLPPSGVYNC